MLKKAKFTYRGMNQDVSKYKRPFDFYFDAENIRIVATDTGTTGSVANDRGNTLVYTLPAGQTIIGHAVLKDYLVVFSTNNNIDKITRIALPTYSAKELFSGKLNFSTQHLIETEVYYESDDIQKVYWVDGINQLRHINIISSGYTQSDATLFDAVPEVTFSAPYVSSVDYGGIHTSGMIQYAYNLVKKNGSQSAISPASELYPLNKNNAGGKVNEFVGKILNVAIDSVDTKYDIIRLYAIKYTSYNEQPSINLIAEETIGNNTQFHFSDDGRIIQAIAPEQFLFLGGTAYIPGSITSKYNRLILSNMKELYFDVSTEDYDTRAYGFPVNSTVTKIKNSEDATYTNITLTEGQVVVSATGQPVATDHDCIGPEAGVETVEINTPGEVLANKTSATGIFEEDGQYQHVRVEAIPTTNMKLHVDLTVTIPSLNTTISKHYLLNSSQSLQTAYFLEEKLNGPDFYLNGYMLNATIMNILEYQGEGIVRNSLVTQVFNNTTGEVIPHSYNIVVKYNTVTQSTSLEDASNHMYNSDKHGATGTNIAVEIVQKPLAEARNVLKSNETYRIGIEFFNSRGQNTEPKWITDLKIPQGNLNGQYNTLKVTLGNTEVLQQLGVVGWRVLRVERTDSDKTILCQGIVNPMIFQNYANIATADISKGAVYADTGLLKIPSPFMRNTTNLYESWKRKPSDSVAPYINKIQHGVCISEESTTGEIDDPRQEIFRDSESGNENSGNNAQLSFEETRLLQLYSPDVIFGNINTSQNLNLKFNHYVTNTIDDCAEWAKQINTDSSLIIGESKRYKTLSLYNQTSSKYSAFNQYARIGGTGDTNLQNKYQYYRKYNFGNFAAYSDNSIVGTPQVVDPGQSGLTYNNNSNYSYTNQLGTILADANHQDGGDGGIVSVNSIGNKNITLALNNYQKLEDLLASSGVPDNSTGVFELVRNIPNQYGGNTYEARSRNSYLRIGRYQPLTTEINHTDIDQAGDTFVGSFRFARIIPNSTSVLSNKYYEMTEIVEFPVETSIDIANRSDASTSWDSVFMPTFDEYHSYNRVYSQQPVFNRTTATPFTFQERKVFNNRINASKVKIPGELVDSWTDILVNEELFVDGKFGQITKIVQNNDIVYCLQEQAVSVLEISPRIQAVSSDGTTIELGKGEVLYNYRYLTTSSGCVNAQSIFKSQSSVYYIDVINRSLNRIVGGDVHGLSDTHGLHALLYNSLNYNTMKYSNLLTGCFDQVSNDAYFTMPTLTIAFNEQTNSFTSKYSFKPKRYIYTTHGMYTSDLGNKLWKHNAGSMGNYYGVYYPSYITLLAAPEPDVDCVFNNCEFKSEVYTFAGAAIHNKTLTSVKCWNEHQGSVETPLVIGRNIARKFWDWNFYIPRDANNPLQRMRGQWLYIKLEFDSTLNEKIVLHDMIVSYDAIKKI